MGETRSISTPVDRLLPWRWAESLSYCNLLWIPVKFDAIPDGQKEWLLSFFLKLSNRLEETHQLHGEHFMQLQTIDDNSGIRQQFMNEMLKETPLIGLSRRPHQQEAAPPATEDIEAFAKKKRQFRAYDYAPASAYWFLDRNDAALRQRYLGYGGLTILYRKQGHANEPDKPAVTATMPLMIPAFLRRDPAIKQLVGDLDLKKPEKMPAFLRDHPSMKQVFNTFDVNSMKEKNGLALSPFRDQSKEIFGGGIQRDLKFEALPFILPRLSSQDFFAHTEIQVRGWFDLFDVYAAESPEDEGIIMACRDDLTAMIATVIEEMRGKGYWYWEG
jgi:hypothetical protein